MNATVTRQVDTQGVASRAQVRELTTDEVDEVAGAAFPLIAAVVIVVVAAVASEEAMDESSSDSEGDGDD